MSTNEMQNKVKELRELARMKEELEAEITAIQDEIKAVMNERACYEFSGPDFKVSWKEVTTSRLDTTALKKSNPGRRRALHENYHIPPFCNCMIGGPRHE